MEAAQWSLAVTACFNASGKSAPEDRLHALQERLAFPPPQVEQTADGTPAKAIEFNSPRRFDPTEPGYRQLITRIREDLIKLADAATLENPEAER
jgi:hypothetical protein